MFVATSRNAKIHLWHSTCGYHRVERATAGHIVHICGTSQIWKDVDTLKLVESTKTFFLPTKILTRDIATLQAEGYWSKIENVISPYGPLKETISAKLSFPFSTILQCDNFFWSFSKHYVSHFLRLGQTRSQGKGTQPGGFRYGAASYMKGFTPAIRIRPTMYCMFATSRNPCSSCVLLSTLSSEIGWLCLSRQSG